MQLYRIKRHLDDKPRFAATMADAKTYGTSDAHRRDLTNTRIDLIDVKLDKAMVVQILNGGDPGGDRLRTWKVTERGGVKEIGA